ncbi:CinA family protein [Crenothrix sp.]|uniref:CinA family protein n=1 Tax=Crenothrix sp. TaxID=3100433 RepID=UPI00374DE9A1
MDKELFVLAQRVGQFLVAQGTTIALAESCTGGLIAATLTEVAGSSAWFDRGFVTYSNQAKIDLLGVKPETLQQYGAVSAETATQMVSGALAHSNAGCAIAVTGIAGPDGGTLEKPVGTVFIAWQWRNREAVVVRKKFDGDRQDVRRQTVWIALEGMVL